MDTRVQLFRHDQKLTARALGEPSLTLVRNDSKFGVLISRGAHEDSFTEHFFLDEVSYLRVAGEEWSYHEFESVALYRREGVWFAQDLKSSRYFPQPSHRPYHVVFISQAEYRRIEYARAEDLAFPVFEAAQRHFGRLPGFSYRDRSLSAPEDYADLPEAVPLAEYVHA